MSVLSFVSLLLLVEVGLGCKYEHTRGHRQRIIQKNIRQGRQLESLESNCKLRDPRRFLQALVVSELLQPVTVGQARQGRRQRNKIEKMNWEIKREDRGERRKKGGEAKGGVEKGQGHKKRWGIKKRERQEKRGNGHEGEERKRKNHGSKKDRKKTGGLKRMPRTDGTGTLTGRLKPAVCRDLLDQLLLQQLQQALEAIDLALAENQAEIDANHNNITGAIDFFTTTLVHDW